MNQFGHGFSILQKAPWRRKEQGVNVSIGIACLFPVDFIETQLRMAIEAVGKKHDLLRLAMKSVPEFEYPVQVVGGQVSYVCHWQSSAEVTTELPEISADHSAMLPQLDVSIRKMADGRHKVTFALPGWMIDAEALTSLVGEIISVYYGSEAKEPLIQFWQVAQWQEQLVSDNDEGKAFWSGYGVAGPRDLPLPFESVAPEHKNNGWEVLCAGVDPVLRRKLYADNVNLADYVLACFANWIFSVTDKDQFTLGYVNHKRTVDVLRDTAALISRTIPLKVSVDRDQSYTSLITGLRDAIDEVSDWSDHFDPSAQLHENIFFSAAFEHLEIPAGIFNDQVCFESITAQPDGHKIKLQLIEEAGRSTLQLYFLRDLISGDNASMIFDQLLALISRKADISRAQVDADFLTPKQTGFIQSAMRLQPDAAVRTGSVLDLFFDQAKKHPNQAALVCGNMTLTYRELDRVSDQIARQVINHGVQRGSLVALFADRSEHTIIGMLGILKAGAGFVPIDAEAPSSRVMHMLEDSRCKCLLTTAALAQHIPPMPGVTVICCDHQQPDDNSLVPMQRANDTTAYVIYTSGSTGKPKGVVVHDNALLNYATWVLNEFRFNTSDSTVLLSSFSFDLGYTAIWGALLSGATLHILPSASKDPGVVLDYLAHHRITFLKMTPSHLFMLVSAPGFAKVAPHLALLKVILGGENFNKDWITEFWRYLPNTEFINHYGPTETTVGTVFNVIGTSDAPEGSLRSALIGKPVPHNYAYLMDERLGLCPPGVSGELVIGGAGVSHGYLNRPDLTSRCFVKSYFFSNENVYRTGDRCRLLGDGRIEFLGRTDNQVKLRGHRIELGEIETVLCSVGNVRQCVAVPVSNNGTVSHLRAFVVVDGELSVDVVKQRAQKLLPEYMIPAELYKLREMPLTANGKVDKKRLADFVVNDLSSRVGYMPAQSPLQETLVTAWEGVLGQSPIGITDDFFSLGGDSIKAIRLIAAISKNLGKDLQMKDLYQHTSIEALSEFLLQETVPADNIRLQQIHAYLAELNNAAQADANVDTVYPMSEVAQGMVYYSLRHKSESIFYDQHIYQFHDDAFDLGLVTQCVKDLVQKHPVLRASFKLTTTGNPPLICVHRYVSVDPQCQDISNLTPARQRAQIAEWLAADRDTPFDFEEGPLWRMVFFRLTPVNYAICWNTHHSILDGWSNYLFLTELFTAYSAARRGTAREQKTLQCSYRDFITEQLMLKGSEATKAYWREALRDFNKLTLPLKNTDRSFSYKQFEIDLWLLQAVTSLAASRKVDVRSVFFCAYIHALSMLSYDNRFVVGIVENCRPVKEDGDKILGCFLNAVPFNHHIDNTRSWGAEIEGINARMRNLKAYGRLPLNEILNAAGVQASNGAAVFDSVFTFVDFHQLNDFSEKHFFEEKSLVTELLDIEGYGFANTLLDFTVSVTFGQPRLAISGRLGDLQAVSADSLFRYFENVLKLMCESPDRQIDKSDILSTQERHRLLSLGGALSTHPMPAGGANVMDSFKQIVRQFADKPAIAYRDETITYAALEKRVDTTAHALASEYNLRQGAVAAILVERSIDMVVAILAVLKCGAAYLPVDPQLPRSRMQFFLDDARADLLIIDSSRLFDIDFYTGNLYAVDTETGQVLMNDNVQVAAEDTAYIIYTSGSTGRPKGVVLTHGGLLNMVARQIDAFGITSADSVLQFASISFDASVSEIFTALLAGAKLVLIDKTVISNLSLFYTYINVHTVTVITFPPSFLNTLDLERLTTLRAIICAGEASIPETAMKCARFARYYNAYGPTEATVCTSIYEFQTSGPAEGAQGTIPIGRPIGGLSVYLLDENLQLLPEGIPGQICIAGTGLSKGYLNLPELTAKSFRISLDERMYLSGDLGVWLPDGNLNYRGRFDSQVKLFGFRIETGEVEHALLRHPDITNTIVRKIQEAQADPYLCAFYIAETTPGPEALRSFLSGALPDYMIPSRFVRVTEFPLTNSGKVDVARLESILHQHDDNTRFVKPANDAEQQLCRIYGEVLGVASMGVTDNFFERGGNSLKAIQIVFRIHKQLGIKVDIEQVFARATIRDLAAAFHVSDRSAYTAIPVTQPMAFYPASHAQKRLWITSQLNEQKNAYNIVNGFIIQGAVDVAVLQNSINSIIERYEILRTTFELQDDQLLQRIHQPGSFAIKFEMHERKYSLKDIEALLVKESRHLFDLENGPLFYCRLLPMDEANCHAFMIVSHHIVLDGWSVNILFNDLALLYKRYSAGETVLPELRIQYKDVAVWQNAQVTAEDLDASGRYWYNKLQGAARISLKRNEGIHGDAGSGYKVTTTNDRFQSQVQVFIEHAQVTPFIIHVCAVFLSLRVEMHAHDIVIGTTVAGRDHPDLEDQLGFFSNTLPLRINIGNDASLAEVLSDTKEAVMQAFQHQHYPFDKIVSDLNIVRKAGESPLFSIMAVLQNVDTPQQQITFPELKMVPFPASQKESKYDFIFGLDSGDGHWTISAEYNASCYSGATADRLLQQYTTIVDRLISESHLTVAELCAQIHPSKQHDPVKDFTFSFE